MMTKQKSVHPKFLSCARVSAGGGGAGGPDGQARRDHRSGRSQDGKKRSTAVLGSLRPSARPSTAVLTLQIVSGHFVIPIYRWRSLYPPSNESFVKTRRRQVINGLNSGASTYMADFEDSSAPTWVNMVSERVSLILAHPSAAAAKVHV